MWRNIGPIETYMILYLGAVPIHFALGYRIARRDGLRWRVWVAAGLCYFVGMSVGAKILYELREEQFAFAKLLDIGFYFEGGLWGGLAAYLGLAVLVVPWQTHERRRALDLVALTVPVPYVLAKLACFLNGCCHGRACSLPWAVTFPEGAAVVPSGVPVHPTQLYEVAAMVLLLVVFGVLNRDYWRGAYLLWFLAIFGAGRAASDVFRGDSEGHFLVGSLTSTQLILLSVAGASVLGLLAWTRFNKRVHDADAPDHV